MENLRSRLGYAIDLGIMKTSKTVKKKMLIPTALVAVMTGSLALTGFAAEQNATTDVGTLDQESAEIAHPAKRPYSPYAGRNFPTRPFFGDTHLHTSYSLD